MTWALAISKKFNPPKDVDDVWDQPWMMLPSHLRV